MNNYWIFGGNLTDRQNARDAIDRARALDPDFPELYVAEGFYWYWGHLDYDQAITNLNKAIDQMPGNAEAHMWLSWALRRDGQWENAVKSVQESLRLDPRVIRSWVGLSSTLGPLGRHDEALAAAETAPDAPDYSDPSVVERILLTHVHTGDKLTADEVFALPEIAVVEPGPHAIDAAAQTIGGIGIIELNVDGGNGLLHVLNGVLTPAAA